MNIIGIDLALRHTGVVILNDKCQIVNTFVISTDKIKDEEIFILYEEIFQTVLKNYDLDIINIEGLSYGSVSSRRDIIAGLFWYLKMFFFKQKLQTNIVPVLSWRNKLFTKQELKNIRLAKKELKKIDRKKSPEQYKILKDQSDIKLQTYLKLPENVKMQFLKQFKKKADIYDATDAYFIAKYSC